MHIIPLKEQHYPALSKIYAEGIALAKLLLRLMSQSGKYGISLI